MRLKDSTKRILNTYCKDTGQKKTDVIDALILNKCLPYLQERDLQIEDKKRGKK